MFKRAGYGVGLVLVGALLVLLSILLEVAGEPAHESRDVNQEHSSVSNETTSSQNPIRLLSFKVLLKFLEHLGVAVIVVGVVGVLLEFKDWEHYFQLQIARTILDKPFLRQLSNAELSSLQIETAKAYFRIDDLDQKDSFLRHFQDRLHGYLGSPFREDVECIITVRSAPNDFWEVEETVAYKCRKVGDTIQDKVLWLYDKFDDHISGVNAFSIGVSVPEITFSLPEFKAQHASLTEREQVFVATVGDDNGWTSEKITITNNDKDFGFELRLKEYSTIDGLHVKVKVKYTTPKNRINYWTMAHLSKNVRVTVAYPEDHLIQVARFGLNQSDVQIEIRPGLFNCSLDSWVMPNTGIAFAVFNNAPRALPNCEPGNRKMAQAASE